MYSPLWKITHQKPSVLCTSPFETSPIKGHRFYVLPPLRNHSSKAIGFMYSPFEKSLFLVGAYIGVGVYFGKYGNYVYMDECWKEFRCNQTVEGSIILRFFPEIYRRLSCGTWWSTRSSWRSRNCRSFARFTIGRLATPHLPQLARPLQPTTTFYWTIFDRSKRRMAVWFVTIRTSGMPHRMAQSLRYLRRLDTLSSI